MFSFLSEVTSLVGNVVKVAVAPVEIVATVANAAVKPIAEVAQDLSKDVKDALN